MLTKESSYSKIPINVIHIIVYLQRFMFYKNVDEKYYKVACAVVLGMCTNVSNAADTTSSGVLYANESENKYVHPEGTIVATRFYIGDAGKNFYR